MMDTNISYHPALIHKSKEYGVQVVGLPRLREFDFDIIKLYRHLCHMGDLEPECTSLVYVPEGCVVPLVHTSGRLTPNSEGYLLRVMRDGKFVRQQYLLGGHFVKSLTFQNPQQRGDLTVWVYQAVITEDE